MSEKTYLSCADTAKLARQALKRAFPSVKFSIRSKVYSGGASISVNWTDGPTTKDVEAIAGKFHGASFDGMIDLKSHHSSVIDGREVQFGADYIFFSRQESDVFMANFRAAWRTMSQSDRDALLSKTQAWQCTHGQVANWSADAELSDFGPWAADVFRCMARQISV